MSKGPGKIERAVVDLVASNPDNAITVEDACVRVYHLAAAYGVDKKHRVAVIRAANSAIKRGANLGLMGWGGRGRAAVLYTPDNLTSCGMAHIRTSASAWWTDEHARERLTHEDYQEHMAPGGAWWCQVELFKAEHDGDAAKVAEIEAQNEKRRQAAGMRLQAMMRSIGR